MRPNPQETADLVTLLENFIFCAVLCMYQYRETLHGLLVTHVDGFLWGVSHVFAENVIKPLHKIFEIVSVNK